MKIGIMTFHKARNIGAILQAYALQTSILDFGIKCEIVDYRNKKIEENNHVKGFKEIRGLKDLAKYILNYKRDTKKNIVFEEFIRDYIKISNQSYDESDIRMANSEYDLFLAGSDQVWNLNLTNNDYNYFLDFVLDKRKKNAYAASFGYSQIPDMYQEQCRSHLGNFNYITLREKQGAITVNNLINTKVETVLDPTLLLTPDRWRSIERFIPLQGIEEGYILLYLISPEDSNYKFARVLAKNKRKKIVYINYSSEIIPGVINVRVVSPNQFIWLLNHASYVVTNSFHGIAFSINFNKRFFYEMSSRKINANSRIENIIDLFGLHERKVSKDINSNVDDGISWNDINAVLENERRKSLSTLLQIVKGIYND